MEKLTERVLTRESGLTRGLSVRQVVMISIGGAIGTGLFLGSTLAISLAGPSVIVSYALGALVALVMAWALMEMSSAIPTAGSFGIYAETFLGQWAGFVTRWLYWIAQVVAIGGEATAAGIYAQFWWPHVPLWYFVVAFSAILVGVNAAAVRVFGTFEYWFSMIKVVAICLFIVLGLATVIWGLGGPAPHLDNVTGRGGFFPNGLAGTWLAMIVVIFSYYGVEVVSVTSGEARDPQTSMRRASYTMVLRLTVFYVLAIAVIVAIVPWTQAGAHTGIFASPFVLVFERAHIPFAATIMNFVVLTAALSSMNTDIYLTTRMLFSLSRSGYAPAFLGRVARHGAPLWALAASTGGLIVAAVLSAAAASGAYFTLFGISIFAGIAVWILILATHVRFRQQAAALGIDRKATASMPFFPWPNVLGILALLAILASAFWTGLAIAWKAGIPTLIALTAIYVGVRWARSRRTATAATR